jgi:hypothetical protein
MNANSPPLSDDLVIKSAPYPVTGFPARGSFTAVAVSSGSADTPLICVDPRSSTIHLTIKNYPKNRAISRCFVTKNIHYDIIV